MTVTGKAASDKAASAGVLAGAVVVARTIKDRSGLRVSKTAIIAVQTALAYLLGEILEGAKLGALADEKKKILPKHITVAVQSDDELQAGIPRRALHFGAARGNNPMADQADAPQPTATKPKRNANVTSHQFARHVKFLARERECRLTASSRDLLQTIAAEITADLAATAGEIARKVHKNTVGGEDVLGAVDIELKGELRNHTIMHVRTALTKAA